MNLAIIFDKFSKMITRFAGGHWAFISAFILVLVWGIAGPMFKYSEGWQMVINTGTTIITFLMVFIIQQSSNKDTKAIHIKLDEIIRAISDADNDVMSIEEKTAAEMERLRGAKVESIQEQ